MNLVEIIVKAQDDASGTLDKAGGSANKLTDTFKNLGTSAGAALAGSGALSVAGALGVAGIAVGAFAAVAGPELSKVQKAMTTTGAAGKKAWDNLTPSQKELGDSIKGLETTFENLQAKLGPVIDSVVSLGTKTASDLMPALGKLATAGGSVISSFLKPFDEMAKSASFQALINQMAQLAVQAGNVLGPALVKLIQQFLQLFVQVAPAGISILQALLPAFTQLVAIMAPGAAALAKLVAAMIDWLAQNHLLVPALIAVAAAMAIMMGASGIGGIIAAIVAVTAIVGLFATHWQQIWTNIKNWFNDAVNFMKNIWNGLPTWLKAPIEAYIDFWKAQWDIIKTVVTAVIGFIKSNWSTITQIFETAFHLFVDDWKIQWDVVKAVVTAVVSFIKGAWSVLEAILEAPFKAAEAVIMGILDAIKSAISGVASAISGLVGAAKSVGNVLGGIGSALGLASGGIVGAANGGVQSGLRLVGEHGPELVNLPTGSTVHSNANTVGMLGQGGGQVITLEFAGGQSSFDQFMLQWMKNQVRVIGGGNVQTAFGRT